MKKPPWRTAVAFRFRGGYQLGMLNIDFEKAFAPFREADGSLLGPFLVEPWLANPDPAQHANIAEIAYLLQAVTNAGPRFRLLALGAAPGEQAIRAERAYRKLHPEGGDYGSVNVEADLSHVLMLERWFQQHSCSLMKNGIVYASATAEDGWSYFPVVEETDWGAAVASFSRNFNTDLDRNLVIASESRTVMRAVPAMSLRRLIEMAAPPIDYLHCDIQGSERDIFAPTMATLNSDVRTVCISIHSTAAHKELQQTFAANGWACLDAVDGVYKYPEWGEECHQDGQLVFRNPRIS